MGCEYFTSLTLSESLTEIESNTFMQCYGFRGDLVIPPSVEYVASQAFDRCGFDGRLVLSPKMSYIDGGFDECYGFSAIVIPEGVRGMVYGAFQSLNKPKELTLPSTLTDIDAYVFSRMDQLEQMSVKCPFPPYIHETTFLNTNRDIPVYVQKGTIEAYRNALHWSEFTNFIEVDGLDELESPVAVEVYPNPDGNMLCFQTDLRDLHLDVYDMTGRLMHSQIATQGTSFVDATQWPSGVYVWTVFSDKKEKAMGKWLKK